MSEALSLRIWQVVSNGEIVDEVEIPQAYMKGKKAGRHVMLNLTSQAAVREWLMQFSH